jgi:hypothetical protein
VPDPLATGENHMDDDLNRPRRGLAWISGLVVLLLVGLVGGWSLRAMLAPAPDVLQAPGYTLVAAQQGSVEHTLRLNTTAWWSPESTVAGQAAGTVTEVHLVAGAEVVPGEVLFTVDLRPVVAAEGAVPAFRDLSQGATGADVTQVQHLLAGLGYWSGQADARFGEGLYWAVRAWQRDLGLPQDGVVRRGDLIFVPELPARLALDEAVTVGAALAGGEPVVQVLPPEPSFTIALPEGQARMVAPGMAVEISHGDGGGWRAEIVEIGRGGETGTVALLAGVDGGSVCGDECDLVPLQQEALLSSVIEVVPRVEGVTVPAAAVVTTAAGETVVVLEDGELRPVEVVASASGVAVVAGVQPGEQVRAPGEVPDQARGDAR